MQHQIQTFADVFCGAGSVQKYPGSGAAVSSHRKSEEMLAVLSTSHLSVHFMFTLEGYQSPVSVYIKEHEPSLLT